MQGFVKHIVTFLCAILVAHIFVTGFHSEDMVFDPIDTDDSAVIKEASCSAQYYITDPFSTDSHKTLAGVFSKQKQGEKNKDLKVLTFKFVSCLSSFFHAHLPVAQVLTSDPVPHYYDYIPRYYKEIKLPPPKYC